MFPAFLGSMMQGLMGGGAGAAGGGMLSGIPGMVSDAANAVGKVSQMPGMGGLQMPGGQQGQQGGAPMVQANPAADPLMSSNSLLNGIGGPLKQFFGMGGN